MPRETFVSVLEGVWASITGGWYYDKKQSDFSNLFHLYIWLLFLCLPFLNYLFVNSTTSWTVYVCLISLLFIIIKLINLYLHRLFDTAKCIEEETILSDGDNVGSKSPTNEDKDVFEMQKITPRRFTRTHLTWNNSQNDNEESKTTETSQKVNCEVDVHFNDIKTHPDDNQSTGQSSVMDLSTLFCEDPSSDQEQDIPQENETVSPLPQNGSLQIVSTSGTSLSNITPTTVNAKPKSTQSVGVIESGDVGPSSMSNFRRARSELESKNSTKTFFNPPSHPVSLEIINSKQTKNESSALQTTQLNRARENVSQIDSSVPFFEETIHSENEQQKSDDKSDDKSEVQPSPDEDSQAIKRKGSKQPSFSGVYTMDFDSSDDGDESEISLCHLHPSSKNRNSLSRKAKNNSTRKVRYSTSNRKRPGKSSSSSKKSFTTKDNVGRYKANPDYYNSDSDFHDELNDTFLCLNSSDSSESISIRPELSHLIPSTSTGIRSNFDARRLVSGRAGGVRSIEYGKRNKAIMALPGDKFISGPDGETTNVTTPLLNSVLPDGVPSTSRTHLATSHEDTSVGAVHVFQDEMGNWLTYTFDENSQGIARGITQPRNSEQSAKSELVPSSSVQIDMSPSNTFVMMNTAGPSSEFGVKLQPRPDTPGFYEMISVPDSSSQGYKSLPPGKFKFSFLFAIFCLTFCLILGDPRHPFMEVPASSEYLYSFNNNFVPASLIPTREKPKKNFYYEMNIFNLRKTKIRFDRLALLAFLDRNINLFELISSIILAILVSIFASIIISHNFFHDLQLVLFCLVVASSQYTLLKVCFPCFWNKFLIDILCFRAFNLTQHHRHMALIVSQYMVVQYIFV